MPQGKSGNSHGWACLIVGMACLTGCGTPPAGSAAPSLPRVGVGSLSWYGDFKKVNPAAAIDDAQAIYGLWGDGLAFVILTDQAQPGSAGAGGSSHTDYDGRFITVAGSRNVDWRCETRDGSSGDMTINGTQYDLTRGSLFLISTRSGQLDVKQLKCDAHQAGPTRDSLETVAKGDPTIGEFFSKK